MADRLIKRRGGHRGECTKLITKLSTMCASDSQSNLQNLENLKAELCRQRDSILKLDSEIQDVIEEDHIETDIAEASKFQVNIKGSLLTLDKMLLVSDRKPDTESNLIKNVKLPTITLPKFDGSILEWQQFWDLYQASIHDRKDISNASKFHYLLSQLIGEAAQLMVGFNHTDAEYEEAISLLKKTYGNSNKLMEAHLHAILDLPSPNPTSRELSKYRSSFEGHLRGLKSLGADIDSAGFVYSTIIIRKLPAKIRDSINREGRTDSWSLTELRAAIETEIGHLQSVEGADHSYDVLSKCSVSGLDSCEKSTISATHVSTGKERKKVCNLCKSDAHTSINCNKYSSVEDRRRQVMEQKLCFNCLKPGGHRANTCLSKLRCKICQRKHHTAVCNNSSNKSDKVEKRSAETTPVITTTTTASAPVSGTGGNDTAVLPTATIQVTGSTFDRYKTRVLFDLGSQKSFVLRTVVTKLCMPIIRTIQLSISGFANKIESKLYDVVQFTVLTKHERILTEAVVVDTLPDDLYMPGRGNAVQLITRLGIDLADPSVDDHVKDIEILIGADQYYNFVYNNSVEGVNLIPSKLGSLMSGVIPNNSVASTTGNVQTVTVLRVGATEEDLNVQLEKFWSLDSIGITNNSSDSKGFDEFKSCIRFDQGRYIANLPWKTEHADLPTNYHVAQRRLYSNLKSMRNNVDLLTDYHKIINDQLDKGFIERVENPKEYVGKLHYIPHHGVRKDSRTTPLRIVFDCSARESHEKPSLNDCLLSGPSLVNELVAILLNFRSFSYACLADIEKAYLMINLNVDDRDSTRFLWPKNPLDPNSETEVYRFKVVFFGATCSQFLLNMSLKVHLDGSTCKHAETIKQSLYIDNVVHSARNESDLVEFYNDSNTLLKEGGFKLREWSSNSNILNKKIESDNNGLYKAIEVNVLGLKWNLDSDLMSFKSHNIATNCEPTKRHILSESSKLFDPFGILIPITIKARMLMQELWKLKIGWDNPVDSVLKGKWEVLADELNMCQTLSWQRNLHLDNKITLHAFCDASTKAYGAVVYINSNNGIKFLIAKARVVPLKPPTLPQLELTAANLAARLISYVKQSYCNKVGDFIVHVWCDSQIVLSWLKKSNIGKQYVQQRVDNISQLVPDAIWHYVKSSDNPADLLSRGVKGQNFLNNTLWFNGPDWLVDESLWPKYNDFDSAGPASPVDNVLISKCSSNMRAEALRSDHVNNFEEYVSRFSSYTRMIRVTAYVLKFINLLKTRKQNGIHSSKILDADEIDKAESVLIRRAQEHHYIDVLKYFNDNKSPIPSIVSQLRLQSVDGVIRSVGRLEHSSLNYNSKLPILLPSKSYFTDLIISNVHNKSCHAGVNHVLSTLREKYWIPCGRQRVKCVLRKCITCKRYHGRTLTMPSVAPYPEFRVTESEPFAVTGVDYTGSLNVRGDNGIKKVYICLFTCMSTRAVHLEIVEDGTAESFLFAFRRFISRRSCPKLMLSDNAAIFSSSAINLQQICERELVANSLSTLKIKWKFIPSRAPHFGGVWERMIGLTKNALKKLLGTSLVSLIELMTLLCEVECVLNDRPLTYTSDSLCDQPLTPSHLIYGRRISGLASAGVDFNEFSDPSYLDKAIFSKREKRLRILLDGFWRKWKEEYVKTLRERDRSLVRSNTSKLSVGDIVLIHDEKSRSFWNCGKIIKLHPSRDGIVRSVDLQTKYGFISRPIIKLVPLEISAADDGANDVNSSKREVSGKPRRLAASNALQRMQLDK